MTTAQHVASVGNCDFQPFSVAPTDMPPTQPRQRLTKREAKAIAKGEDPKKPKLTKEEQEELEEKELEEWCERWCGKVIRIVTLGSMAWGMLTSVSEWAFRPPVLIDRQNLRDLPPYVLTGGTQGIGAATARQLALDGARVVLGARNLTAAEEFVATLRAETGNPGVEARHLDLAKLSSVAMFAKSFADEEMGVAALLNNAASAGDDGCSRTEDGFALATQVNFLAPALLTKLLLPSLIEAGGSRAVQVVCPITSTLSVTKHHELIEMLEQLPGLPMDEAAASSTCNAFGRYAAAKLLLLSFSTQLSSRRGGDALTLTSNAYDPGAINTPGAEAYAAKAQASRRMGIGPQVIIRKVLGFVLGPIFGPLFRYLARQFKRPVDEGGRGLVHLATSPDLNKISGKLYTIGAPVNGPLNRPSGCARQPISDCGLGPLPTALPNATFAAELWDAAHAALAPWLVESEGVRGECKLPVDSLCGAAVAATGEEGEW